MKHRHTWRIAAVLIVSIVAAAALGVLAVQQYDAGTQVHAAVTLSGQSISVVQGGFVRRLTLANAMSPMQDASILAKDAPVWETFCGASARVYCDGTPAKMLQAEAISADGQVQTLQTGGNALILPETEGTYTVDVRAHFEGGYVQLAFRVRIYDAPAP